MLALLNAHGVEYTLHEFHHEPNSHDFGLEAARQLQLDPSQVFKTLVWEVDAHNCVGITPTSTTVSAKKLASALNGRRAQLADTSVAERLSGSVTGAISPLGLRRKLPTVVDISALDHEVIFVSAGRRGLEVALDPRAVIELTNATVASISSSHRLP